MKKIVERTKVKILKKDFEWDSERYLLLEQQIITKYVQSTEIDNKYNTNHEKENDSIVFRATYINRAPKLWGDEIEKRIGSKATIYRVISNAPIITHYLHDKIKEGGITLDEIAWKQAVRHDSCQGLSLNDRIRMWEEFEKLYDHDENFILDSKGKVQYSAFFFSNTYKEDIDIRGNKNHPEYISKEIAAELSKNNFGTK